MCVCIFELKFVCEFSNFRSIPSKQNCNTMTGPQELKRKRERKHACMLFLTPELLRCGGGKGKSGWRPSTVDFGYVKCACYATPRSLAQKVNDHVGRAGRPVYTSNQSRHSVVTVELFNMKMAF